MIVGQARTAYSRRQTDATVQFVRRGRGLLERLFPRLEVFTWIW